MIGPGSDKNTIRDGGSTTLYAAYTVDTVDAVDMDYTVDMVYTVDMIYTIDMVYTVDTVDNVYTVMWLKLLIIAYKGFWEPYGVTIGWMDGWMGSYPLDCCDY